MHKRECITSRLRVKFADITDLRIGISAFSGLAFVVSEGRNLSPSAEALRDASRVFGVEVATIADPAYSTPPGGFILSVGPRA